MDIRFFIGTPFLVARQEGVLCANNLSFEKSGQCGVIFSEAYFVKKNSVRQRQVKETGVQEENIP